jgi:hypothetical protein
MVFETSHLKPGDYEVCIQNPGGLETALGPFSIAASSGDGDGGFFDPRMCVSAAWSPLFPLYGRLNDFLDTRVFLPGASARISFIPFRRAFGSLGLELAPFWSRLSANPGGSDMSAQLAGAHANLLFQKCLAGDTLALNLRLGAGLSRLQDFYLEGGAYAMNSPVSTTRPSAGAGISLMWFFTETFFTEAGADYLHCFFVDTPAGYARAILGCGLLIGK